MHELSLCQDMLEQVITIANKYQADKVERIILRIGPLSGAEPKLLETAFSFISADTVAEQAELVVEIEPVRILCCACGLESEVSANNLICTGCGSYDTQLLSGDSLILARVELMGLN